MDSTEYFPLVYLNSEEYLSGTHIRKVSLEGHLGLENLPLQVVKQQMADGFIFNILCIGETGIGKSSLISSLFNIDLGIEVQLSHQNSSVELVSRTYPKYEEKVGLKITVTETIGYGDQINLKNSYEPIVNFIDSQMEEYLQEELRVHRSFSFFKDSRIHVCLFFLCPTGHGLKSLDLACLKSIHRKVNVIPIVAKADTLSRSDLARFKDTIMKELLREEIQIYDRVVDDESIFEVDYSLPLAVVGSREFVVLDGKMVRGRIYPWGTVVVEDEAHSEFSVLREILVHSNTTDLVELTHAKHYERYRTERLEHLGLGETSVEGDIVDSMRSEVEREIEEVREKNRLEKEAFIRGYLLRVKQRFQELMEEEETVKERYRKLFLEAENEEKELKEQERELEEEIAAFQKLKGQFPRAGYQMKEKA